MKNLNRKFINIYKDKKMKKDCEFGSKNNLPVVIEFFD